MRISSGVGLSPGGGAADDRANPYLAQLEAVVAAGGGGLAGKAELVEDRVHEVSGAVAGEGTAGAVGSVSAWRETHDENACIGVAEPGHRLGPVLLVTVGFATRLADAANVVDEARTTSAIGDGLLKLCDVLLALIQDREGMFCDRPLGAHEESSLEPGNCFDIVSR